MKQNLDIRLLEYPNILAKEQEFVQALMTAGTSQLPTHPLHAFGGKTRGSPGLYFEHHNTSDSVSVGCFDDPYSA